jgi:hypothetical protein
MTARPFRAFVGPLLGAVFLVAACTPVQQAVVGQGVEKIRQAKDAEAEVLKASVCAMSLGAYHRVNDATERRALDVLRGGEWARPVTVDDLRSLREFGALFGGS